MNTERIYVCAIDDPTRQPTVKCLQQEIQTNIGICTVDGRMQGSL
jgi:hypothetical protein